MENEEKQTSANATPRPGRKSSSRGRISRRLVITSSAAVLAVYAIGFARTQSAADQIMAASSVVRSGQPSPTVAPAQSTAATVAQAPSASPSTRKIEADSGESDDRDETASRDDANDGESENDSADARATAEPASSRQSAPAATVAPAVDPTIAGPTPTPTSAAAATTLPTAVPTAISTGYRDGTYSGTGVSRHGNVTAQVTVKSGKMVAAQITRASTRYPVSRIASLPGEVLAAQSTNVDMVSGATDSSLAYLQAVTNALTQAT